MLHIQLGVASQLIYMLSTRLLGLKGSLDISIDPRAIPGCGPTIQGFVCLLALREHGHELDSPQGGRGSP